MSTLWDQALAELRSTLPSQEFAAWISCLRPATEDDDALTVEAPNHFHRNWVQQHFLERIRTILETVAGHPVPVQVSVGAARPSAAPAPIPAPIRVPRRPADATAASQLTFATFVVGPSNRLASAAAHAVVATPGRQYNPLFIHGGVGLGKTHLLQAIANALRTEHRSMRVLSISAERFINEMVTAVRRQQMEVFHQRFRRTDALLVDDIQFIAGKERTQEEFFHTFNLLCAAGKQIVVSSDKPPRAIPDLEQGLRSRFEGGMIAEVQRPDRETRRRILAQKAEQAGMSMDDAVLDYLATRVRASSVRELEGALTRLQAIGALVGRPIDVPLAEEAIDPLYPPTEDRTTAERIEEAVVTSLGVELRQIASPQRATRVVFARQVAMYLMRRRLGMSLGEIGARYGRDHTTVLHAVRAIDARAAGDPEVRRLVSALEEQL